MFRDLVKPHKIIDKKEGKCRDMTPQAVGFESSID